MSMKRKPGFEAGVTVCRQVPTLKIQTSAHSLRSIGCDGGKKLCSKIVYDKKGLISKIVVSVAKGMAVGYVPRRAPTKARRYEVFIPLYDRNLPKAHLGTLNVRRRHRQLDVLFQKPRHGKRTNGVLEQLFLPFTNWTGDSL